MSSAISAFLNSLKVINMKYISSGFKINFIELVENAPSDLDELLCNINWGWKIYLMVK